MDLYVKHGTPAFQQNYNIYKRVVSDMLKAKDLMRADAYRTWADLRDMLHDLVRSIEESKSQHLTPFLTCN